VTLTTPDIAVLELPVASSRAPRRCLLFLLCTADARVAVAGRTPLSSNSFSLTLPGPVSITPSLSLSRSSPRTVGPSGNTLNAAWNREGGGGEEA
jgi:hypothetical protein